MKVELKFISPLKLVVDGIRVCYDSEDKCDSTWEKLGDKDKALIETIIQDGHTSTLEHSLITYKFENISRAVLQEISRHRHSSPSVQSTRYTLKKTMDSPLYKTGHQVLDNLNKEHMEKLKLLSKFSSENGQPIPNDILKYGIVESYLIKEQISFNFRGLLNFFELRTSPRALKEIRDLSRAMFEVLPDEYKFMFDHFFVYKLN